MNSIPKGLAVVMVIGFLFMATLSIYRISRDYMVLNYGHKVEVVIKSVKNDIAPRGKATLYFYMDGAVYQKDANGENAWRYWHPGEKIMLIYLEGYENNFLFPGERQWVPFVALLVFGLVGIVGSLYYGFLEKGI